MMQHLSKRVTVWGREGPGEGPGEGPAPSLTRKCLIQHQNVSPPLQTGRPSYSQDNMVHADNAQLRRRAY